MGRLVAVVAVEGEGVVGGEGSDWVLSDVLVLRVLVVECVEERAGKAVALVAEHCGFLGFILVAASCRDGGEAMHVGW